MTDTRLFKPLKVGNVALQHRIAMAPLTRFRNTDDFVSLPTVKEYYTQRAAVPGTLLITEATIVSPRASGYPNVPGIWKPSQITAWKEIVEAVHKKGSFIFLQLWAVGRVAYANVVEKEGYQVVSSSAKQVDEEHVKPHALTVSEIKEFVSDFASAARNAIEGAGFDGVEIHGANGYLVDQFTQDTVNSRTDEYGGNTENRTRFAVELTSAVVDAIGADKTAIRLSPWSEFQGMKMKDPIPEFTYLVNELKKLKLAYLHLVESRIHGSIDADNPSKDEGLQPFVSAWDNTSPVLLAGGFDPEKAKVAAEQEFPNTDVVIVFGRHFISTPDLVYRIRHGLELNKYDRSTFYGQSDKGYIDYPFSEEFKREIGVEA